MTIIGYGGGQGQGNVEQVLGSEHPRTQVSYGRGCCACYKDIDPDQPHAVEKVGGHWFYVHAGCSLGSYLREDRP